MLSCYGDSQNISQTPYNSDKKYIQWVVYSGIFAVFIFCIVGSVCCTTNTTGTVCSCNLFVVNICRETNIYWTIQKGFRSTQIEQLCLPQINTRKGENL